MWGHHPAFATKLLARGRFETRAHIFESHAPANSAIARVAAGTVHSWPLFTGKDGRQIDLSYLPENGERLSEMGYLSDFEEGRLVLSNDSLGLAAELCWDAKMFPHLRYWLEWGGSSEPSVWTFSRRGFRAI